MANTQYDIVLDDGQTCSRKSYTTYAGANTAWAKLLAMFANLSALDNTLTVYNIHDDRFMIDWQNPDGGSITRQFRIEESK